MNDDMLVLILEDEDIVLYDWSPYFFMSDPLAAWLANEMLERIESLDILGGL